MDSNIMQVLTDMLNRKEEAALVIITEKEGSSPRGTGSMMVVNREGCLVAGTIGGGEVEERAKKDAANSIIRGISRSFSYILDRESADLQKLSMTCGGNVRVFVQVFKNPERLLIAGGGHIALALHKLARILGYHVAIMDNREGLMTKERFPEADELLVGDIPAQLRDYPIDGDTNIVIITHGHQQDEAVLAEVIGRPSRYIGMIGSSKKIAHCFQSLEKKGVDGNWLTKVHAPIGLDLGGESPEEIALAIMAEIQAVKYGRKGGFLNEAGK